MTLTSHFYSLDYIESYIQNNGVPTLPSNVNDLLNKLNADLLLHVTTDHSAGVNSGNGHSHYDKKKRPQTQYVTRRNVGKEDSRDKKNSHTGTRDTTDWEVLRSFKTTKIENKEGVDKSISEIRILLNKLSNKNFETQKDIILKKVDEFIDECDEEDDDSSIEKYAKSIFDMVSTNKFFVDMYVDLYSCLMTNHQIFSDIMSTAIAGFKNTVDNLVYADPETDYDAYCVYNKSNDNRKAFTVFMMHLFKMNKVDEDTVFNILDHFLEMTHRFISMEGKRNEVEEITENVYLMVNKNVATLSASIRWNYSMQTIIELSQLKTHEYPSLTNRAVFKYMDIIECL